MKQKLRWCFKQKKLGDKFIKAFNRLPKSEYKLIIISILEQYKRSKFLTKKQWNYLGVLMTKADPYCSGNPTIILPVKKPFPKSLKERFIGTRKKISA